MAAFVIANFTKETFSVFESASSDSDPESQYTRLLI